MTDYLTLTEVLAIHKDQIERYGGASGVRDMGLLEAALFRPQTGYYQDVIEQAAAVWESLAMNHPFVDGNKRVAFAVTYVFLAINGIALIAKPEQTFGFIVSSLEQGAFEQPRLVSWLRAHTRQL
jgi:death-on-curing protein